jgi:hypothetical protein
MVKVKPTSLKQKSSTDNGTVSVTEPVTLKDVRPRVFTRKLMVKKLNDCLSTLELDTIFIPGKTPVTYRKHFFESLDQCKRSIEKLKKALIGFNQWVLFDNYSVRQLMTREQLDILNVSYDKNTRPLNPPMESEIIIHPTPRVAKESRLEVIVQQVRNLPSVHPQVPQEFVPQNILNSINKNLLIDSLRGETIRYYNPVEVIDLTTDISTSRQESYNTEQALKILHYDTLCPDNNENDVIDITSLDDIDIKMEPLSPKNDIVQEAIILSNIPC